MRSKSTSNYILVNSLMKSVILEWIFRSEMVGLSETNKYFGSAQADVGIFDLYCYNTIDCININPKDLLSSQYIHKFGKQRATFNIHTTNNTS